MMDAGTGYLGVGLVSSQDGRTMISTLDTEWMSRHGMPEALSANDENNNRVVELYLTARSIQFKARPARRHNSVGIVERNNGVLQRVIRRLQENHIDSTDAELISRAIFVSNMFTG